MVAIHPDEIKKVDSELKIGERTLPLWLWHYLTQTLIAGTERSRLQNVSVCDLLYVACCSHIWHILQGWIQVVIEVRIPQKQRSVVLPPSTPKYPIQSASRNAHPFEFAVGTVRERRYLSLYQTTLWVFHDGCHGSTIELVLHSHQYCNTLVPLVPTVRTCTSASPTGIPNLGWYYEG